MTLDDRARRAAWNFHDAAEDSERAAPDRRSFERFDRYLRRRRRNQRIAAAVVATFVVAAVFGAATIVLGERTVPADRDLQPNVEEPTGTNGKIVFNEDFMQNDSDFVYSFTINPDGSDRTQVGPAGPTVCGGNDDTWAPDGAEIVCQAYRRNLTVGTATVDADGSNYEVLSNPDVPASFACVAWAPDGTRLLCPFTSDWVYTIGSDGKDLVRLTSTSAGAGPAGFAGDGSYAYFTVEDATERRTLFSVKTDGSGRLTALSPPSVSVHVNDYFDGVSADPSPDGSKMVFAADVTNTRRALYIVGIKGGEARRIETPDIDPTSAQWSPDGSWIAFSARPPTANASYDVYLIHPDGRGMAAVTSPADGCSSYAPIWSPDGTKLLFETQCSNGSAIISTTLETASVDGSESSKVVDLNGLTAYSWGRLAAG